MLDDLATCGVTGFYLGDAPTAMTGSSQIGALLWAPDGSGTGITVDISAGQAARIATSQASCRNIYIEDVNHTPWPRCTQHRQAGTRC